MIFLETNPWWFIINHYIATRLLIHPFILSQIQELTARAQETNTIPTEWEGVSLVTSTYVIDCVRAEDQGLKYCVSVSKNIVAQSAATVLLVNSKRNNNISPRYRLLSTELSDTTLYCPQAPRLPNAAVRVSPLSPCTLLGDSLFNIARWFFRAGPWVNRRLIYSGWII